MISDLKGAIINGIKAEKIIDPPKWKFGLGDVTINNSLKKEEIRSTIYFDLHRLTYMSSIVPTNEVYTNKFNKLYKVFKEAVGKENVSIKRIGCRVMGTYSTNEDSYDKILDKFLKVFPEQFLLDDFDANDMLFQLTYANGMYNIGPIKPDDTFLKSQFNYDDRNNSIGFAIDTDNYVSRKEDDKQPIADSKIKDVILASLSVEKFLFEKLNSL